MSEHDPEQHDTGEHDAAGGADGPPALAPYLAFLLVSTVAVGGGIAFGILGMRDRGRQPAATERAERVERPAPARSPDHGAKMNDEQGKNAKAHAVATFGAGCFWCVEAVLERVPGVHDVVSGYMGGATERPSYSDVCTGQTGHAEVVQVHFDPDVVSYEALLEWFWKLHDPTTRDRQGADVGTQYRSAIFVHDAEQRRVAEASRDAHGAQFTSPIVTEITDASRFWEAEGDHQDYYRLNPNAGYCRAVIAPKLDKLAPDSKGR